MEREEERLKSTNRDLMMVKMKSMFAIGFAFTSLLSMFNSIFDGKVVAKLPFTPIPWLQGLSHRNLLGTGCPNKFQMRSFSANIKICAIEARYALLSQNVNKLSRVFSFFVTFSNFLLNSCLKLGMILSKVTIFSMTVYR